MSSLPYPSSQETGLYVKKTQTSEPQQWEKLANHQNREYTDKK